MRSAVSAEARAITHITDSKILAACRERDTAGTTAIDFPCV